MKRLGGRADVPLNFDGEQTNNVLIRRTVDAFENEGSPIDLGHWAE